MERMREENGNEGTENGADGTLVRMEQTEHEWELLHSATRPHTSSILGHT